MGNPFGDRFKKAQKDAEKRAKDAAAKKAQEEAKKAQEEAKKAQEVAAKKAQEVAAKKAQEEAKKAQQVVPAAAAAGNQNITTGSINNIINNPQISQNAQLLKSSGNIGNEIKKQKEQLDDKIKLLTTAAVAGTGLVAGGLGYLGELSKNMKNMDTFSRENRTNVKNMYVIMPDMNTNKKYIKNPDYKPFVNDYGCQIVPFKFYNKDSQLTEYEKFFNYNKSACIPMALAVNYIRQKKNDGE
jgi:hypothetical protein